jgi:hypothetical protein
MSRPHPRVYEIPTVPWLVELSKGGPAVTLGSVPSREWGRLGELGLDYVWLMGVWDKSLVGRDLFRARADMGELIRVMGFAALPLALSALMFIPLIDFGVGLISVALLFGLNVIAVQTTTDAPAGRVLVAVGAGFAVWAIILTFLAGDADDNTLAPGFFLFDTGKEFLIDRGNEFLINLGDIIPSE